MAIKIKSAKTQQSSTKDIDTLTGIARQLAQLIVDHGDYEFEGFNWLTGTFGGIAEVLGVSSKTIERCAKNPPFHYITRRSVADGKHILIKLGIEASESALVSQLQTVWVRGLLHFNGAAAQAWPIEAYKLKQAELPVQRLLKRIEKAEERLPELEKLKAGKPVSRQVRPHEMGLLRECVRQLGDDVFATIACLTSWNGWHKFMSYMKITGKVEDRYYHWPTLGHIAANPDIALQTYLDMQQEEGKISTSESASLQAKIEKLSALKAT